MVRPLTAVGDLRVQVGVGRGLLEDGQRAVETVGAEHPMPLGIIGDRVAALADRQFGHDAAAIVDEECV